jgi:ATP/ADP translocase
MKLRRVIDWMDLTEEQFQRGLPFFVIYSMLFGALTIADAAAVALFVSRVGADSLPKWYIVNALGSLVIISVYLILVTQVSSAKMFQWILIAISAVWLLAWALQGLAGLLAFGLLYVSREIALTMILMHFGTFLQDYFDREELNTVLPAIYAGGRIGGIFGGVVVWQVAAPLGTNNLILGSIILLSCAYLGILWIGDWQVHMHHAEPDQSPNAVAGAYPQGTPSRGEQETNRTFARNWAGLHGFSLARAYAFLSQVIHTPLLGWLTATTLLFVVCRWLLVFQYSTVLESSFPNDSDLAAFLGIYTQVALCLSLLLQVFVVTRLVRFLGVGSTHLIYCFSVFACLATNFLTAGLATAVVSRFVETELRFGLRNPVNQMLVNRFPKTKRIAIRGWSLGFLIPVGTLIASLLIALVQSLGYSFGIGALGLLFGLSYLISGRKIDKAYRNYTEAE